MVNRAGTVSLLRLLRLAANRPGHAGEAAALLENFYVNQSAKGSLPSGWPFTNQTYSHNKSFWEPFGRRQYSKESPSVTEPSKSSSKKRKSLSKKKARKAKDGDLASVHAPVKTGQKSKPQATGKHKLVVSKAKHSPEGPKAKHSPEGPKPKHNPEGPKPEPYRRESIRSLQSHTPNLAPLQRLRPRNQHPVRVQAVAALMKEVNFQGPQKAEDAQPKSPAKVPSAEALYKKFRSEAQKSEGKQIRRVPRDGSLAEALGAFKLDSGVRDKALALYVSSEAFPDLSEGFAGFIWSMQKASHRLEKALESLHAEGTRMNYLFKMFAKYVVENHADELTRYRDTINTLDLRQPFRWYPIARSLKRKFVYHAGPTNSGKTYTALQRMMEVSSGVYCGPLRLLAMEVFDACNAAGTFCNLLTGQEQRIVPGAEHTACTIEMLDTSNRVDVAVVDEVQLIGDDSRGWAWTKAVLALPANEIHLCGDSSAVKLIQKMAGEMGEEIEIREYQRFTPVQIESQAMEGGYQSVREGDCVVAFSRKAIYEVKASIERHTGLRACLIYGALPPETRRQQAKLFNELNNEYDVLVASDAVGMGLNLNIRRIIFTTLVKNLGGKKRTISTSEIKQIAGRAGRRNSQYPTGYATCMNKKELPKLEKAMAAPMSDLNTPTAGLFPEFEHFEAFAGKALIADFSELIERFGQEARLDGTYFFCRQSSVLGIAKLLQGLPNLSLKEKFTFSNSPVNIRDSRQAACLLHFATRYANKLPVNLEVMVPEKVPTTADELQHMEGLHQVVSLWLWLSQRFDSTAFPNREEAVRLSLRLIAQMDSSLYKLSSTPEDLQTAHKLRAKELKEQMRRPYLRNLCDEAKMHQDKEQAAKAKGLNKRLHLQIQSFRKSASDKWKQSEQTEQRAVATA